VSAPLGTWVDGDRADRVPLADRGLQYGDGLFETLLVRERRPRFLELHLARLKLGCERLRLRFEAWDELRADIATAAALAPALAIVKIIVTRGDGLRRGYAPDGGEIPRRIVALFESAAAGWPGQGVDLHHASFAAADQSVLAGVKHLNRLENVLASREARDAGAFDALMTGADGRVISGAMSNIFVVIDGALLTPRVDRAGVAGVMRAIVLRECSALGLIATEWHLTLADLHRADEAFITNARIGVVPVRRVGEHVYQMNVIGRRIAAHVETLDA
jgi:4-amino-4-deoxychorismate lyase